MSAEPIVERPRRHWTSADVFEVPLQRVFHSDRASDGRLSGSWADPPHNPTPVAATFEEPEDMGTAQPSDLAVEAYVDDVVRPGRITTVAAVESTGKSAAMEELAVRVALAGGKFAGTWPISAQAKVAYCSEMHRDDDLARITTVCRALGFEREDLAAKLYRIDPYTTANGTPPLALPTWRDSTTDWCRVHGVTLLIFDTATTASRIDPWGRAMHELFAGLRSMMAAYPALAVILLVHLKKPAGHRGARGLEDVLGEWGRFNDITLLMEREGDDHVRLTLRKRVNHERRIVCRKTDGLLVEPTEVEGGHAKVPSDRVLAAIAASPGITYAELAETIGVSRNTAKGYVRGIGREWVDERRAPDARHTIRLFIVDRPVNPTVTVSPSVNTLVDRAFDRSPGPYLSGVNAPIGRGGVDIDGSPPPDDDPEYARDDDVPPAKWNLI